MNRRNLYCSKRKSKQKNKVLLPSAFCPSSLSSHIVEIRRLKLAASETAKAARIKASHDAEPAAKRAKAPKQTLLDQATDFLESILQARSGNSALATDSTVFATSLDLLSNLRNAKSAIKASKALAHEGVGKLADGLVLVERTTSQVLQTCRDIIVRAGISQPGLQRPAVLSVTQILLWLLPALEDIFATLCSSASASDSIVQDQRKTSEAVILSQVSVRK